jgi:hypothetical protein
MAELEGAGEDEILLRLVVGGIAACPMPHPAGCGDRGRHLRLGTDRDRFAPVFVFLRVQREGVTKGAHGRWTVRNAHAGHVPSPDELAREGR